MVERKKRALFLLSAVIFALLITLSAVFAPTHKDGVRQNNTATVKAVADESTTLVPGENYTIIFSSDANQMDATIATELRTLFRKAGQTLSMRMDTQQKEGTYELLIGNTNRQLSMDLLAACQEQVENDSLVWGFAYRDGKFAFAAATDEAFNRGSKELYERFITEENHLVVPNDLWLIVSLSRADYDAELKAEQDRIEAEKEQARLEKIERLKEEIAKFTFADFTDDVTLDYTVMKNSGEWGKPHLYPTAGEHPRLNITKESLEYIKEYLKTYEGKKLYEGLLTNASYEHNGILPEATVHDTGRMGYHNMDEGCLAIIEARAFLYLLTGDEAWGYDAICTMKNFLKTIDIRWIHSDQCREFGRILFTLAEVYDWCYDLLSTDDKNQFMVAATDICSSYVAPEYSGKCQSGDAQMEVGYPPSKQGSVSGHGSEHQILRDYLSVAIAIFDENPSWYEYVGARVYNDYVATRNYYYKSGTYQQGINTYAAFRHNADTWSAWMLLCATGENPYVPELEHVTLSFFEYELPDGTFFGTGDGVRRSGAAGEMSRDAVIIMALYGNSVLRQRVLNAWRNFENFKGGSIEMSYVSMINFSAAYWHKTGLTTGTPLHDGEEPVSYHGHPIGQMIARSEWNNADAPAVFMKVGERSTGNHEHADSGSFQIFYKGLYSGESGMYDSYGSTHFVYYHQSTVAHNSLLVFNPNLAAYELDGTTVDNSSNFVKSFYSGSQKRIGEISNLDSWLASDNHKTGTITGMEYAFKDNGKTDYAYLAGDISASYQAAQASNVVRRMFTLFTEDEKYPMYFIVYDQITAVQDTFVKKFLLHTPTEPVIDEENKTVTLTDKDGRLVLHSLSGGDKFEALGGEGRNYLINGIQCALSFTSNDGNWGRVEISNTGALSSDFLNFMYVTDATNDEKLTPVKIEEEKLSGIQLGTDVVIFTKSTDDRNTEELVFNTSGTGLNRYFITGMYEGTWHISVDGVTVGHRVSSEEGGMITFYAPAGEVCIKPGSNIASSNGGRIIYNSFGGIVPDDAPLVYEIGVPVALPETIVRGKDEFLGWFTSPTFEEETRITEVLGTNKGKFNVYASFRSYPVLEDYEDKDFKILDITKQVGDLSYYAGGKIGSCFETVKDEQTNNTYLRISHQSSDMEIYATQTPFSYLGSYTKLTFELDLAKDGDKAPIGSSIRLRENTNKKLATVLAIGNDGSVSLAGQKQMFSLTEDFQKAIVTIDFAESTMTSYNIFGDETGKVTFAPPATAATKDTLEWANMLTCTFNWWIGSGGESFLLDNIKVYCGDYNAKEIVLPEDEARIIYHAGVGVLPTGYPLTYKAGVPTELPIPTSGNNKFLGWYTTPTFDTGTEISIIDRDVAENITVYAKWIVSVYENDFTGADFDYSSAVNNTLNGIQYQIKAGAYAKTVTDESGNTYVTVYTGDSDSTLNNFSGVGSAARENGGKVTFVIDLATLSDGRNGWSDFRIRGPISYKDTLTIFSTQGGNVCLGGDASLPILTLSAKLKQVAITLDINAETVTAYNKYGDVIATKKVSVPSVSAAENVSEWIATISHCFNWQFGATGGIAFDNLKIYTGEFIPEKEVIPENSLTVKYETLGGSLTDEAERYIPKGSTYTLPTDIKNGNYTFIGWYTDPSYADGTQLTEITSEGDGEITLYARWYGSIYKNDFTGESFEFADATTHSSGGIQYQLASKTDAVAKTETDELGNTFIKVLTVNTDATINNYTSLAGGLMIGGGKITFTIDLANYSDTQLGGTEFRIRGTGNWSDTLYIFTTAGGKVYLGGNVNYEIATLSTELQKIIITLDAKAGTLTAYGRYGDIIASMPTSAPGGADIEAWVSANNYMFNWQISKYSGIAFDNIDVLAGPYVPETEVIPEGHIKVEYQTNGGVLSETPDRYVSTADAPYILPTDITNGTNVFLGWYTDPSFSAASKITEIPQGTTTDVSVYAQWSTTILDFKAENVNFNLEGDPNGGVKGASAGGLYFQTKGADSYIHTLTDEAGKKYLLWSKGTLDPQISIDGNLAQKAGGNKRLTFSLTLAKEPDKSFVGFQARMRPQNKHEFNLFRLAEDGGLYLASGTTEDMLVGSFGEEFKTLHVVIDFADGMLFGYNELGEKTCESVMYLDETFGTYEAMYNAVNLNIMNIYARKSSATAVRIDAISIKTGNLFE